jgi:hypothetical protein
MKIRTLCLLTVLGFSTIGISQQNQLRMDGLTMMLSRDGSFYILPGNVAFTSGGFEFQVYNWPSGIIVTKGQQEVIIVYSAVPMLCVELLQDGVFLAVIPSVEIWRENCRFLDGFMRQQVRDIDVCDSADLRTIYLRNPPKR